MSDPLDLVKSALASCAAMWSTWIPSESKDRARSLPSASTATHAPSDVRSLPRTMVSGSSEADAPTSRRSSAAITGPRKGLSTRPRPSSSAMIAASTPSANGLPCGPGVRNSFQPASSIALASLARRPESANAATDAGARSSTTREAVSLSAICSAESRTSTVTTTLPIALEARAAAPCPMATAE